ncbi:MAG: YidC/Oxa1 family membrane protein insertase [Clostridia bacterium]|nr:YidC/Oxa1 family membrane protein insertase [Clostridia bacterium]
MIFSNYFGYVLNWLYNVVGQNYGLAIILFTLLIRVVILPITYKQQKSMKKSTELQGKIKEIQFKYKNDQNQMQKEVMELYKSENISPFSGCLSAILQLVIILSVFWLISKPLTYMKKIDSGIIEGYKNEIMQENGNNKISNYYEIEIIDKKSAQDESVRINMNFLGLDLSKVPGQNLNDYRVYIIPALYIVSSIVSMRFMTNKKKNKRKALGDGTEKTKSEEPDMSEQMNKSMSLITPIMAVSIAFIAPLGLALYWFVSNLLMIIERIAITKYVDSKEDKEDA